MAPAGKPRKWLRWTVAGVVAVLVIVVGGPFVYIHFVEPDPEKTPTLADTPTTALQAGETCAPLAGTWKITSGSVVQYRVKEVLFGQDSTATGSTKSITGSMKIAGTQVDTASFTVDMTTVTSDKSVRDGQFQGRIMDTAEFPTATFELSKPIELGARAQRRREEDVPGDGKADVARNDQGRHCSKSSPRRTAKPHRGPGQHPGHVLRLRHRRPEWRPGQRRQRRPAGVRAPVRTELSIRGRRSRIGEVR